MANKLSHPQERAILPGSVEPDSRYTVPRTYGVYRLSRAGGSRQFRFGNHPVRMKELKREFSSCELEALFLTRAEAQALAVLLNGSNA